MAGLLDMLGNLNPEQTQGLLAVASQMMQASGPSRTPTSFGQIAGLGMESYQASTVAAKRRKLEEEQAKQMAQMRALQMQGMQGDLQDKELARNTPRMPEYGQDVKVGQDETGKTFSYVMDKHGNPKRLDGILPRTEMKLADLGGKSMAYNPFALQNGQAFDKTQTPDSLASSNNAAASRAQAERHFKERQSSEQNRFLQGTKPMTQLQETKYRTQIAKDYQSANTILANMDALTESAAAVKNAKGLGGATGLSSYFPSMPDGDAAQAEVKLQNLEGKVTQLGKAAAAMGGAVGPMAVQEWKIVRDMIAAIDPKKGEEALKEQIGIVEATAAGASARLRDAYTKHYSADFERYPQFEQLGQAKAPAAPAAPKAPAGTQFSVTAPNGKTYSFPDAKSLANFKMKAGIK